MDGPKPLSKTYFDACFISDKASHRLERLFWIIVISCGFFCASLLLWDAFTDWVENPTGTESKRQIFLPSAMYTQSGLYGTGSKGRYQASGTLQSGMKKECRNWLTAGSHLQLTAILFQQTARWLPTDIGKWHPFFCLNAVQVSVWLS